MILRVRDRSPGSNSGRKRRDLHALDQPIRHRESMAHMHVGKNAAGEVVDDLMIVHHDTAVIFPVKRCRLDVRIDLAPLVRPIGRIFSCPRTNPPLKAFGQDTSRVMVARAAPISLALKAAWAARSAAMSNSIWSGISGWRRIGVKRGGTRGVPTPKNPGEECIPRFPRLCRWRSPCPFQ